MTVYWLMFLITSILAFTEQAKLVVGEAIERRNRNLPGWIVAGVCLTLIIGLRYEVGGDWFNYIRSLLMGQHLSLGEMLSRGDPGYRLFNWLSVSLGMGIYGVNLLCAIVFVTGLIVFCRSQPRSVLALVVAIPYMVMVLGMGYSRQGVALGLAMIGLVALTNRSILWFLFWGEYS